MSTITPAMTVDEYLAFERASDTRHEFCDGEVVEMVGASEPHSILVGNLTTWINTSIFKTDSEARLYPQDMRVRIPATGKYTYPDIAITAAEPALEDEHFDTLLNPMVLIEVLSPTTEAYDRGRKFEEYRNIDTFREYFLVSQDRIHIECFRKNENGEWVFSEHTAAEEQLLISTLEISIPVSDIYRRVRFA